VSNEYQNPLRTRLLFLLEDVPSLSNKMPEAIVRAYSKALEVAVKETGLSGLPKQCPYSEKQLL